MPRRLAALVVIVFLALVVAGSALVFIQKSRASQDLVYSVNNLRELGQFAELHLARLPNRPAVRDEFDAVTRPKFAPTPLDDLERLGLEAAIPAGTVAGSAPLPADRLSWFVPLLPTLNQRRQATARDLYAPLNQSRGWAESPNRAVAGRPLVVARMLTNPIPPVPGEPAVTQFVGLGGVLPADPAGPRTPSSGAFAYDRPTPFGLITDGLSETAMFADVSTNLGPWLAGGSATVRVFDPAKPAVGAGAQFGGNTPQGSLFGFADHSVRLLTPRADAAVVRNHLTISGAGTVDVLPGE